MEEAKEEVAQLLRFNRELEVRLENAARMPPAGTGAQAPGERERLLQQRMASMQERNAKLEVVLPELEQRNAELQVDLRVTRAKLDTQDLPDQTIKRKYVDLNQNYELLRTKHETTVGRYAELQDSSKKQAALEDTLLQQFGDLTKTMRQVYQCVEHAISLCDGVLGVPGDPFRSEADQTVAELRKQINQVVASLRPASARSAKRLRDVDQHHHQQQLGYQSGASPSPAPSPAAAAAPTYDTYRKASSPLRAVSPAAKKQLAEPAAATAGVLRARAQPRASVSPVHGERTRTPQRRRSPRRPLRSPDRAPLVEFVVRGGDVKSPLGIQFGFREGSSHGLLEIAEIDAGTAAAQNRSLVRGMLLAEVQHRCV